jgi:hypothetical protein
VEGTSRLFAGGWFRETHSFWQEPQGTASSAWQWLSINHRHLGGYLPKQLMIIYLLHTCDTFDYQYKLKVQEYKMDVKSKGNSIILSFKERQITIPLANIVAIEEQ